MSNNQILDFYGVKHLFHMTHIDNLPSILKHGLLAHNNSHKKVDISDCDVNNRRSRKEPIYNKSIHSYVPFYFNPKNNMLSRRRNIQDDIVILVFKKELLLKQGTIFTDSNASTDRAEFYNNLKDLKKLNFKCIYTKGYYSGYEDGANKRMAEVLVQDYVSSNHIEAIICNNFRTKNRATLTSSNQTIINKNFYF